jgi:ech hydrogenase subunit A
MVLLCFAFPAVSKFVVTPYLAGVYGHASAVLSSDNILIMIIMLVLIFVVPMVTMILLRRSHITFEDTYLAGVNTGKQTYFYDAMGEPKHSWITNWYLTDLFGETKLWNPSVVLSTAAILIYTVIALGGAVR